MSRSGRRGDGIGIEVTPGGLRGVRLHRETAGRIAAVAHVSADTGDEAAMLDALVRLHDELGAEDTTTRLCAFGPGDALQSIDVTGWSREEHRAHLAALADDEGSRNGFVAAFDVGGGARQWLTHVRHDEVVTARLARLCVRAGFVSPIVEPTPMAVARVLPGGTMTVTDSMSTPAWSALTHEHVVIAAAPAAAIERKHAMQLVAAPSPGPLADLAERLVADDVLTEVLERRATTERPTALELLLVGDPVASFPETHPWWGPGLAAALGAAVGAAGLAGKAGDLRPIDRRRLDYAAASAWVIERTGDASPAPPARRAQRRRATMEGRWARRNKRVG